MGPEKCHDSTRIPATGWVVNRLIGIAALCVVTSSPATAFEHVLGELESSVVPSPVQYALIAPDGFRQSKDLPLVLNLHGGGGSRDNLQGQAQIWQRLWDSGALPAAVVVMPSVTARGFYMNFRDGSERWQDFIVGDLLEQLRIRYPVTSDPKRTFITGISMGGMGALRIAFRYPEMFGAVAALEPGIEPILSFEQMQPKHRFWRSDELLQRAFGKPVDEDFWAANNPATMAVAHADSIRSSGLQIYVEAGDEDEFWLYEGAEFLHQILWQQRIRHEYHLIRGAGHVGASMGERIEEAARFLFRSYNPWPVTPRTRAVNRLLDPLKARIDGVDHYHETPAQPSQ